jgi:hypothetical protein
MADVQATQVTSLGEHRYEVRIGSGRSLSVHKVRVADGFAAALGLGSLDEERLVGESFAFLLERESPSSILREFDLQVISRYFPEYESELRRRLGA